jgi:hypothetical protein
MAPFASKGRLYSFNLRHILCILIVLASLTAPSIAQQANAPDPQTGSISGTATDVDQEVIPGATVTLEGPAPFAARTFVTDSNGAFIFTNLSAGGPYYVSINANGLIPWTSPGVFVKLGQVEFLSDIKIQLSGGASSVTVTASSVQIATQQVNVEEKQRVLGIVPNYYVVYDRNAVPLTTKLKFSLAWKAETDPVVFLGAAALSGMDQAGDTPNYVQGAKGYGERLGANYTTGFADIMIGGAILPTLLRQDPRYFYQGTGTTRSRLMHALSSPFVCKGDNGRWEPNFSSVGGDLAAGAIAETYYPLSNRGPALVFQSSLITTGGRMANGVIQEFLLRRLTPSARAQYQ